jgi:hypothetical protein
VRKLPAPGSRRNGNLTPIVIFLALFAMIDPVLAADAQLILANGISITLPKKLEYTALLRNGSIGTSQDQQSAKLPSEHFLLTAQDWDAELFVSIFQQPIGIDKNPIPADADFSLDSFAKRYERQGEKRKTGAVNTIQRIALTQKSEGDSIIIDHEFYVLPGNDPVSPSALYVHLVHVYRTKSVTVLKIEFPKAKEPECGVSMKGVSDSLVVGSVP